MSWDEYRALRGFNSLIGDVYEAGLDAAKWRPLAPRIAAFFDASSCGLQWRDQDCGAITLLSVTENFTPQAVREYVEHYYQFDEWANRGLALPANQAMLGQQLIPSSELARTEFDDWLRRMNQRYLVGAVMADEVEQLGIIGVHRETEEFDADHRRLMHLLIPHLQRAFRIGRELETERLHGSIGFEALGRLAVAVLLVAEDGRILFANGAAEALLDDEGGGLSSVSGRIGAKSARVDDRLKALIAAAARGRAGLSVGTGGQLEIPRRGCKPLTVLVCPLPAEQLGILSIVRAAFLLIRDPAQQGTIDPAGLRALFGLTPAEARLAIALAEGRSLEGFAAVQGISAHTARTQLKWIMAKTETSRQGELVALLLRSTAAVRPLKS